MASLLDLQTEIGVKQGNLGRDCILAKLESVFKDLGRVMAWCDMEAGRSSVLVGKVFVCERRKGSK